MYGYVADATKKAHRRRRGWLRWRGSIVREETVSDIGPARAKINICSGVTRAQAYNSTSELQALQRLEIQQDGIGLGLLGVLRFGNCGRLAYWSRNTWVCVESVTGAEISRLDQTICTATPTLHVQCTVIWLPTLPAIVTLPAETFDAHPPTLWLCMTCPLGD